MAGKTKAVNEALIQRCKTVLKQEGRQGESSRRLQAIISVKEHGVSKVALIYNITRMTLMNWIKAFAQEGLEGFKVKPGRGRKRVLTIKQEAIVTDLLEQEPNLTIDQLQQILRERLKIYLSRATVHRLMGRLEYAYITPRASHYKSDPVAKEEFKKKSKRNCRRK